MRFTKKEHIITTIFNDEVFDDDTIISIFENLQKYGIEFSLVIRRYFASIGDHKLIPYSKVKVKKVHGEDRTVDICVVKHSSLATLSGVSFDDITDVTAITMSNHILNKKLSEATRFDILDIKPKE